MDGRPCDAEGVLVGLPCVGIQTETSDMSQSQNDARLDDLANKVHALRGVTIDIHGQASDQSYIDANVNTFPQPSIMTTTPSTPLIH